MQLNMKQELRDFKLSLKTNLRDLVEYFSSMRERTPLVLLMMTLSAFLVCLGLNFDNSVLIYSGLLISPFIYAFIQFTLGVYLRDFRLLIQSGIKIFLGSILTTLIGLIYFYLTPIAYDFKSVVSWAEVDLSVYIAIFVLAITMDLFNRQRVSLAIWILKLLLNWPVFCIIYGIYILLGDWESIFLLTIQYKLVVISFFIGFFSLLFSFGIERKDGVKSGWLFTLILVSSLLFGLYFGGQEFMKYTTEHNANQYLHNGLRTNSFEVNNFVIEKGNKEITVFYTGLKPAKVQDEDLKKKFHLEGYHFEYKELK